MTFHHAFPKIIYFFDLRINKNIFVLRRFSHTSCRYTSNYLSIYLSISIYLPIYLSSLAPFPFEWGDSSAYSLSIHPDILNLGQQAQVNRAAKYKCFLTFHFVDQVDSSRGTDVSNETPIFINRTTILHRIKN